MPRNFCRLDHSVFAFPARVRGFPFEENSARPVVPMRTATCWGVNGIFANLLVLVIMLSSLGFLRAETAGETSITAVSPQVFRIGFLAADPDAQFGAGALYELRSFLLAQPGFVAALHQEGISDVALLAVESHEAMVQRMNRDEFDLAFCSAIDFVLQSGDYEARFQLRRPRDSMDPRGSRVFHRGVIFVNNRSRLFGAALTPTELAATLTSMPLAMVSASAAGYYYPSVRIARLSPMRSLPQRIHLCESSEEVVKTVINGLGGLIEAGACEAGALDRVLEQSGLLEQRDKLVRVVLETDPIPAEPVALRRCWLPRTSSLGRQLCEALQRFFTYERGLPRLEPSSNEKFQDVRENLREFWLLVGRPQSRP